METTEVEEKRDRREEKGIGYKRPPKRSNWYKGMPSPNPKGRGLAGESWKGIMRDVSNRTFREQAERVGENTEMGRMLMQQPNVNVSIKEAIVTRVAIALMNDPTPGLWNGWMERQEGRVPLAIDVTTVTLDSAAIEARIFELMETARQRAQLEAGEVVDAEAVDLEKAENES